MEWFYVDAKNQQVGPYDEDDMAAMISGAKVLPDTLVWKEGYPDWVPARSVVEFGGLFVDYGEQATMIGGMTFAQGGFQTDVQPPSYAVKSEESTAHSPAQSTRDPQAGSKAEGIIARVLQWLRQLLGR